MKGPHLARAQELYAELHHGSYGARELLNVVLLDPELDPALRAELIRCIEQVLGALDVLETTLWVFRIVPCKDSPEQA